MKRKPIILSAAVGALLVWGGLLVKGYSIDVDEYLSYRDYLSEQLQNDLAVNHTVIDLQQDLQPAYDPLVQKLHHLTEVQAKLKRFPSFLNRHETQQLQAILDDSNQVLAQKADLVEKFQAQNLLVKDALSALTAVIDDPEGEIGVSATDQMYGPLLKLLNLVALYSASSDETLVADIQRDIAQVQTLLANSDRNDIKTTLSHVRVILENKSQVAQTTQSLSALPSTQQLQTLYDAYGNAYQTAIKRARLYQLAATLWIVGMVGVAAYGLLQKIQSRKVEKITNFLSESIDEAFIDVDSQWHITYANSYAAKDLDTSVDELTGQLIWDILPAELGKDKEQYYQEACKKRCLVTFETRFTSKAHWLELRLSPSMDGLSIFWQDISSRKKAEFQLALSLEANDEALKEAHEAQKKAETERLKAEKANQAKSEFLANMSHELRTPLNAIIGYSEMLEEDAQDIEQEDFIPELQKIQGAGKHLLGLINDVLDLSKVEAGHMEMYLETFLIMPLVEDVAATMQPVIEKNNNILKIQCSDSIHTMYADQIKVRQSLFNLLSNASKFTQGGTITVSVSSEKTGNQQWIIFQIQDTGIGMLPEQLQNIFNAFAQADSSTTRKYGGTGLGLTITKRFVQMMGGTVNVDSEVGRGTTFTVKIPQTIAEPLLAPNAIDAVDNLTASTDANNGKHTESVTFDQSITSLITAPGSECILVMDEDDASCKLIWKTLVSQGYFVVLTHNKRKGLKMADQLLPDFILLDSILLRDDQYDIFEALDASPTLAKIPVVVQTKLPNRKLRYSLGKVDNLSKDNNLQQLLGILNTYHPQQIVDAYGGSCGQKNSQNIGINVTQ